MMPRIFASLIGFAMSGVFGAALPASAQTALTEQEAHAIGVAAYLYFYPLVTMDVTRKQLTNIEPGKGFGGPMNTFANVPAYPTAADRAVVRPNFDTLYSSGWLDLTKEPMIVKTADRIILAPVGRALADELQIDTKNIAATLNALGLKACAHSSYESFMAELKTALSGDVLLFMSNGDFGGHLLFNKE